MCLDLRCRVYQMNDTEFDPRDATWVPRNTHREYLLFIGDNYPIVKSEYSPRVFLGTHIASRGSNSTPFIWYSRHLRSGHMVTYIVKVHT